MVTSPLQQSQPLLWLSGTERLAPDRLKEEQRRALSEPRSNYHFLARILFWGMDAFYGKKGNLRKFKVLEIIARMPYQAWENVAYVTITHDHADKTFARQTFERVQECRRQQDNEQWHLLILTELIDKRGLRRRRLLDSVLPQVVAFFYYHVSWILFAINPSRSYELNADFEDHAEHEYFEFVVAHPELDQAPFESDFTKEFGTFASLGDLFRQIGYDEHIHKVESLKRAFEGRLKRG